MFVNVYACVSLQKSEETVWILDLEFEIVMSCPMWVLGTEFVPSVRMVITIIYFLKLSHVSIHWSYFKARKKWWNPSSHLCLTPQTIYGKYLFYIQWNERCQQQDENWKIHTYAEIRHLFLKNQQVKEEIKREMF